MAPKISVLIYTARGDHPYANPEWHCFDPVVKTLAQQTFTDFELIIVDLLWETRADWFLKNPQPFRVKHVPSRPNYWQDRGKVGLCGQINRGFAWADGELVWMGAENNMFPKTHLENVWNTYKQTNKTPVAWYGMCGREPANQPHPQCPVDFDLLGYARNYITEMDHRAFRFVEDQALQLSDCHHQHYFGYSAVPLEVAFAINGFDELMDGQWGLFDVDFGSRLDLHGVKLVMSRNIYVIEPPVASLSYSGVTRDVLIRCNYAIYLHNRSSGRRVNRELPHKYVKSVQKAACYDACSLRKKCKEGNANLGVHHASPTIGEAVVYPFCEGPQHHLALEGFAKAPVRELREEWQWRLAGKPPYDRGTITGS